MNGFMRDILALPEQASSFAKEIDFLHYFVITVTMVGATFIGVTAVVFVYRYKRKPEHVLTRPVKIPLAIEVGIIGGLLGLFILWWIIGYRQFIHMRRAPANAMEAYVMAKQWMWKFSYPNGRSSIAVLTVPTGKPIKLNMISRDVIHSFFVPAFRIKQDVLPGRYTTVWFQVDTPGTYPIMCTEYCGTSHSTMRGDIVALAPSDYERWLAETSQRPGGDPSLAAGLAGDEPLLARSRPPGIADSIDEPPTPMAQAGREIAVRQGCLACHTTDGRRHVGPSWRGLYGSEITLADGATLTADEDYITESIMDPRAKIHATYAPLMPTYWGILDAAETASLVEYIKSLRGPRRDDEIFPGRPLENLQAPENSDADIPKNISGGSADEQP